MVEIMSAFFSYIYTYIHTNIYTYIRIVRLTSPNLNYSILAGALLMYGSAFVRLPYTSNLTVWDFSCKVGILNFN